METPGGRFRNWRGIRDDRLEVGVARMREENARSTVGNERSILRFRRWNYERECELYKLDIEKCRSHSGGNESEDFGEQVWRKRDAMKTLFLVEDYMAGK